MTDTQVDTRDRLLQIGADLFIELGYTETSLRTIADRAGLKAASIYYHFNSKDVLLADILRLGMERITAAHEDAVAETSEAPPEVRLRAAIAAHLRALFAYGPFTAAHVTVFSRAPAAVRDTIVPIRDEYEGRWADLFRSLGATGSIRPGVDLHLTRLTLLGSMNSSLEWFVPGRQRPLEALIDHFAQTTWHGIRTPDQEDAR